MKKLLPDCDQEFVMTLVLDLDETLIHTVFDFTTYADFTVSLPITRETAAFQTDFDKNYITAYVSIRPGAKHFLELLKQYYEIVIWTASPKDYADPILEAMGIKDTVTRVLTKEDCRRTQDNMYKDLDDLNRDVKRVVIVDDNELCYVKHPERGIKV